MDRKIKLIWDFHGGHAKGTAAHHSIHLGDFATREKLSSHGHGTEDLTDTKYSGQHSFCCLQHWSIVLWIKRLSLNQP